MTVRLQEVIEVPRPIDEAYAFVADFANAERWDPGVERSRRAGGPEGVGARYELTVTFNGRRLPMVYTTIRAEPPHRVVLSGRGATVTAVDDIAFEATPAGGTRITYIADLSMRHVFRLLEGRLRERFDRMGRNALAGMRVALSADPDSSSRPSGADSS